MAWQRARQSLSLSLSHSRTHSDLLAATAAQNISGRRRPDAILRGRAELRASPTRWRCNAAARARLACWQFVRTRVRLTTRRAARPAAHAKQPNACVDPPLATQFRVQFACSLSASLYVCPAGRLRVRVRLSRSVPVAFALRLSCSLCLIVWPLALGLQSSPLIRCDWQLAARWRSSRAETLLASQLTSATLSARLEASREAVCQFPVLRRPGQSELIAQAGPAPSQLWQLSGRF